MGQIISAKLAKIGEGMVRTGNERGAIKPHDCTLRLHTTRACHLSI